MSPTYFHYEEFWPWLMLEFAKHHEEGSSQAFSRKASLSRPDPEGPSTQYRGFWFQKPYPEWLLAPEPSNVGYLDPLGEVSRK